MSAAVVPSALSRRDRRRAEPVQRGPRWFLRLPLALLFAAAGITLFVVEKTMRGVEVALAQHVLPWLFASEATTAELRGSPIVLFKQGDSWLGLRMTAECSIAFYVGAILLFAALMTLIPRFAISRVLFATAIAGGLMIVLNQVRLAALAWVFGEYGRETFEWAHSIGGSFLMIGGLGVALTVFFYLVVRRGRAAKVRDRGRARRRA